MNTTQPSPQQLLTLAENVAATLLCAPSSAGQRQEARNTFMAMLDRALLNAPEHGMFTPQGNLAVDRLVKRLVRKAQDAELMPSLDAMEEQLDGELEYLARNTDFEEADDTDVREQAWHALRKGLGA